MIKWELNKNILRVRGLPDVWIKTWTKESDHEIRQGPQPKKHYVEIRNLMGVRLGGSINSLIQPDEYLYYLKPEGPAWCWNNLSVEKLSRDLKFKEYLSDFRGRHSGESNPVYAMIRVELWEALQKDLQFVQNSRKYYGEDALRLH